MPFPLKKLFFAILFNSSLFLILMIGIQNSSSQKKVNLIIKQTIRFIPNTNICNEAVTFKNCATTGCEAIWSNENEKEKYVTEAKSRGLLCGVKSD